jgi:NAD(P)-dependent dehydrogenase (short-subunit alcohol dehydrogenase family)
VEDCLIFEIRTAPLLEKSGTKVDPSRIIVVGSVAGFLVPQVGENGTIIYSVSKAAAHHLARNLAVELGPRNIGTNVVAPGFFPSKLANGLIENLGGTEKLNKGNPRGRLGEPEDIAGVMVYLCSLAAAYVNGATTVPIDGGEHLAVGMKTKL